MRLGLHARRLLEEIHKASCLGFPTLSVEQKVRIEPCSQKRRGASKLRAISKLESLGLVEIIKHKKTGGAGRAKTELHLIEVSLTENGHAYCGAVMGV